MCCLHVLYIPNRAHKRPMEATCAPTLMGCHNANGGW